MHPKNHRRNIMDRNSYIGLGLIFALLIGYFIINQPSEQELALQKHYADSIELVNQNKKAKEEYERVNAIRIQDSIKLAKAADTNLLQKEYGEYASQVQGEEKLYTLENDEIIATFTNKGAAIKQIQLKKYKTDSKKPVLLLDEKFSDNHLEFVEKGKTIKTNEFYWEKVDVGPRTISFVLHNGSQASLTYTYTLPQTGFNMSQSISGKGIQAQNMVLNWKNDLNLQEREIEVEKLKSTVYFKLPEESADYISETSNKSEKLEDKAEWVSFKQQFFNATIVPEKPFLKESTIATEDAISASNVKNVSAQLKLDVPVQNEQNFQLKYFFGPNQYQLLKDQNIGLDKIIPLGWGIFGWINRFFIIPVFNFLQSYLSNYGIIILCLTLIIKFMLLPLVFKSYKSTAKMRLLKPELDEIKAKYENDAQKIQMENLAMYRKAGVNPLGGCLPMLLQMPILIAVFQFVPSAFEFRQQAFLWADDLSIYDSIWNFGKIPVINSIYGDHVSLFTLLMTISTLIYTKMNNELTTGMNEQMKYISYIMPILFLGFFNKYAAALTYYYFLSNVITFSQQWAIRKFVDEDKLKAQIHEAKNRKDSDKKSAFQKRLEEMAKQRGVDVNGAGKKK